MDDALFVRGFERFRDLLRDGQRFVEQQGSARDALRQIVAFDELHHQRGHIPAFFEAVDRGDVRMVQGGEQFCFALETCEPVSIGGERRWQDLDRDLSFESRVGGPVDLSHSTFADRPGDVVDADARAGSEGQM